MKLQLTINAKTHELDCTPGESLFAVLRRLGYYGVKFGDEQGLSGADTIILDGIN
jgi:putative selenate reductase molybdopterin-binding subunit